MPKKKRFSKTPAEILENPVVEDEKPSLNPKNSSNEIDDIFSGKKRKKAEGKKSEKSNKNDNTVEPKLVKSKKEKQKRKVEKENSFSESSIQSKKKTADGFTIYTEEELGINKSDAGNTPLCPFDCSCCF